MLEVVIISVISDSSGNSGSYTLFKGIVVMVVIEVVVLLAVVIP